MGFNNGIGMFRFKGLLELRRLGNLGFIDIWGRLGRLRVMFFVMLFEIWLGWVELRVFFEVIIIWDGVIGWVWIGLVRLRLNRGIFVMSV